MSRFISTAGQMMADLVARTADDGRVSRGRTLYRKGAVLDVSIEPGSLIASVRGSEGDVYASSVGTSPAPPGVARQVAQSLADGGTIDALLDDGVDVCPREIDLGFSCECADWDEPCKHVVALLLAFADRVDLDVDDLLVWRGIDPQLVADNADAGPPPERPVVSDRPTEPGTEPATEPQPTKPQPTDEASSFEETPSFDEAHDAEEGSSFDEAHERSERLADLKKLLGDTVLRPSRSRDQADDSDQPRATISTELAAFLGTDTAIQAPDLGAIAAPAPLFAELQLGPLADLGPEFALAIAAVSDVLDRIEQPET